MASEEKRKGVPLPGNHAYVCPSCTVMRFGDRTADCPVCGYEDEPDRVYFDDSF